MARDLAVKLRTFERAVERELRARQRQFRQSVPRYLRASRLRNMLTAPVLYSLIVPFVLLDAWVTAYQWSCFPLYGIPRVRRRDYVIVDRQRLGYLNAIEKANCVYCGYVNGLVAYVREVAGRTEQYWCPIRHARQPRHAHAHYRDFVGYEDAAGYRRELPRLRAALTRPSRGARRGGGRGGHGP